MTKKIVRFLFFVYQAISAGGNASCRFTPTCSHYAVEAIEKYGMLKGLLLAVRRLAACHPFTKHPIYDPVQ